MRQLVKIGIILSLITTLSGCEFNSAPDPGTYGHLIRLQGASNTTDLGGIQTSNGQRIRSHRLIRSNQLAHLSKKDITTLSRQYHLTAIADLRTVTESRQMPDVEIDGVTYFQDSVLSDRVAKVTTTRYYQNLVSAPTAMRGYRALFNQMLANRHGALLYHCTYGKDRSGIATVLILSALGVSQKTILREYLRSNYNLSRGSRLAFKDPSDPNQSFTKVSSNDLAVAYRQIDHRYGSMTRFLRRLGLTSAKQRQLKAMYLTH